MAVNGYFFSSVWDAINAFISDSQMSVNFLNEEDEKTAHFVRCVVFFRWHPHAPSLHLLSSFVVFIFHTIISFFCCSLSVFRCTIDKQYVRNKQQQQQQKKLSNRATNFSVSHKILHIIIYIFPFIRIAWALTLSPLPKTHTLTYHRRKKTAHTHKIRFHF